MQPGPPYFLSRGDQLAHCLSCQSEGLPNPCIRPLRMGLYESNHFSRSPVIVPSFSTSSHGIPFSSPRIYYDVTGCQALGGLPYDLASTIRGPALCPGPLIVYNKIAVVLRILSSLRRDSELMGCPRLDLRSPHNRAIAPSMRALIPWRDWGTCHLVNG